MMSAGMVILERGLATFCLLVCLLSPCHAFQILSIHEQYIYELYEPKDTIPLQLLNEGRDMYFEAYQHPKLHAGIPVEKLQIDLSRFHSYEEFMQDMFQTDFVSYHTPQEIPRYYFQVRSKKDGAVVSICAVLALCQKGSYYIDHIGVHKDYRHQGIASNLLTQVFHTLPDCYHIALDTRVFNTSAQALYEKLQFQKLQIHPNPKKQHTYFHYVREGN